MDDWITQVQAALINFLMNVKRRNSSMSISIGYGLDGRGWCPGSGKKFFCTRQRPDRLESHMASYISAGVKRPGHDSELKNNRAKPWLPYTSV